MFNDSIVTDFELIKPNEKIIFPGVSVCIEKTTKDEALPVEIKEYVQKYYAEHNIKEPNL